MAIGKMLNFSPAKSFRENKDVIEVAGNCGSFPNTHKKVSDN